MAKTPRGKIEDLELKSYCQESKWTLENHFKRISSAAIMDVFSASGHNFTVAYKRLAVIEQQRRDQLAGGTGMGRFDVIRKHIKVFLRKDREIKRVRLNNAKLRRETDAMTGLTLYLPILVDLTLDDSDEEETGDAAVAKEAEMECRCCYGDFPRSELNECKAGSDHFVCKTCLYRYVSEQLDGNGRSTFKCICDASCPHEYSTVLLDQSLSPKLNKRVNDLLIREEIKKAGIPFWTCPKCAYMGFMERQETWMQCPECNANYCTNCNEIYHEGQNCEEARREKERLRDPSQRAHEAMSQACKRKCPHCNQEYTKGDGCNKIRCMRKDCGKYSCYLCGVKVVDYSHFCNCSRICKCGNTCRLWTSTERMEEIDRQKRHAAGRKVLQKEGMTDEKKILSILASPPAKRNAEAAKARGDEAAIGGIGLALGAPNVAEEMRVEAERCHIT